MSLRKPNLHRLLSRRGTLLLTAVVTLAMGMSLKTGTRYVDQSAISVFYGASLAFVVVVMAAILMFNQVRLSRVHHRLRRRQAQLDQLFIREQALLDSMPGFAWISNNIGVIVSANPKFAELFGYAPAAEHFLPAPAADTDAISHHEAIRTKGTSTYDLSLEDMTGGQHHYRVIKTACPDGAFVASVAVDVSDLVRAEESNRFLAEHDSLTGLANRATLLKRLPDYLSMAKESGASMSVLFIDLDGFKEINDSLGHEAGDKLLIEITRRLKATVSVSDLVSRHGGDEFVLLISNTTEDTTAELSEKLLAATMTPLVIGGRQISISASIGVALYPSDAADAVHLLKCADIAMYVAKRSGKNRYSFYVAEDKSISGRARISIDLRQAIHRSELSLKFQPQYDLQSRLMLGVESLLVWNHPELGNIPPSQFIPVAEESDLILSISRWVLQEACSCGKRWLDEGVAPFTIAVNISPKHLQSGDLVEDVMAAIRTTGFPLYLLEIEITEGVLIDVTGDALARIEVLRASGVNIAIDDFGVGYSSLEYLARLPIDKVKLDQSLVANINDQGKHAAITKAVIKLCKSLGMTV
ncbi:MAG: EAL domain-containing protein, partial [Georgfuchsia sp.]